MEGPCPGWTGRGMASVLSVGGRRQRVGWLSVGQGGCRGGGEGRPVRGGVEEREGWWGL